jgi:hypothetical protein
MPRTRTPWIKIDADADESDKVAGLPNHSARWGWLRMMCRAKTQRRMGIFAGTVHLRQLLGTEGRYVPDMVKAGLLHAWPVDTDDCDRCASDYAQDATDGDLVVHDFRREQRDPTNADRQSGYRERNADRNGESNGESNGFVPTLSRALSPSLSESPSVAPPREPYQLADPRRDALEAMAAIEDLTHRQFSWGVGSKICDTLVADVADLGLDRVVAEYRAVKVAADGDPIDAAGIVFGAHKRLYRIPDGPRPPKPVASPKGMVQDISEIRRQLDAR